MMKVQEFRKLAAECRRLARTGLPRHRDTLLKMAESWQELADQRERRQPAAQPAPKAESD
jgi:hypothetical protein